MKKLLFLNSITKVRKILTITKYSITFVIICLSALYGNSISAFLGGIELAATIALTELLLRHHKRIGTIYNIVMIFIINVQLTILRFSGTFISLILATNIGNISALVGKMSTYITSALIVVVVSLLPVTCLYKIRLNQKYNIIRGIAILVALIAVEAFTFIGGAEAPISSLCKFGKDLYDYTVTYKQIVEELDGEMHDEFLTEFYKEAVGDYFQKPDTLNDTPNIVLIFTEGLSQSVIEDERNIMPNVKEYEEKSLFFENYYNHTSATYRGIIGQLFSAHQFNNTDANRLISVQSILQEKGYNTTFLNPEPQHEVFTEYLNNLGFNSVVSNETKDRYHSSDKDMYELLYNILDNSNDGTPQFIAMYTFCTHVSHDTDDEIYGDGANSVLNKFYNTDYQFGIFMDRIIESELADNTIIIFTTDHATYCDDDFRSTFYPDYKRDDVFCDEIPLFIWYKGVNPHTVNTNGRNSLGLAPTILDFLDMDAPNYFLGNSLFQDIESQQELLINTTYAIPAGTSGNARAKTYNGKIRGLTSEEVLEFNTILYEYLSCAIKL